VNSGRRQLLLADGIAALSVLLFLVGTVFLRIAEPDAGIGAVVNSAAFILGFGGMGWLLARRLPQNPLGWSLSVGGFMWALSGAVGGWAQLALTGHVGLGAVARLCVLLDGFDWIFAMPFSVQLPLLLLPDGQLISRRWRPAAWLLLAGGTLGTLGFLTIPGHIEGTAPERHLVNPLGVRLLGSVPRAVAILGAASLLLGMLIGVAAVVVRFRRSHGVQRQQLLWVVLGGCLLLLAPLAAFLPAIPPAISNVVSALAIFALPVCIAIAVLRYKLYDLGRLVSRTASYATVSAILIGLYAGLVTLSASVASGTSSLTVAAATLAAAALFQPMRRRVQGVIDQRFNRARFDAARTVEEFSLRLRDEVELDAVRADLVAVVGTTMQPTVVFLWLRGTT